MSEAFIVRRGGGTPFAAIGVKYPEGSVCTCTNGSLSYTAPDTGGRALFPLPEAGTWTVTAAGGSKTRSASVEIGAKGQVETVELAYELLLFSPNNEHSDVTGGWQISGQGSGSSGSTLDISIQPYNNTESHQAATSNAIDLSKYSILRAQVASCTLSDATCSAGMNAGDAYVAIEGEGQVELDVSGINSAVTISFGVSSYSGTSEIKISQVSLI